MVRATRPILGVGAARSARTLARVPAIRIHSSRASATSVVVSCVLAGLVLGGCEGDSTEPTDGPSGDTTTSSTQSTPAYDPPGGKVVFDLRVRPRDRKAAVDAYAAWQRASTTALRRRTMIAAVGDHAAEGPTQLVKQSVATVREEDYTVPRRMVGRVESVRASRGAAIVRVCLWSPSFDYHDRETGESATNSTPRWMGVEVRMTRSSGQDGRWIVAGLSTRADCEGNRP